MQGKGQENGNPEVIYKLQKKRNEIPEVKKGKLKRKEERFVLNNKKQAIVGRKHLIV